MLRPKIQRVGRNLLLDRVHGCDQAHPQIGEVGGRCEQSRTEPFLRRAEDHVKPRSLRFTLLFTLCLPHPDL